MLEEKIQKGQKAGGTICCYQDNIGVSCEVSKTRENGWVLNKNKEHPAETNQTDFEDEEDEINFVNTLCHHECTTLKS
jgi:hypothetical protein